MSYGESSVTLTESEFKVLEYLCSNLGKTVTRQELNMLLGADSSNISDVYVCHLRKKLEALSARKLIYTERSRGYRIEIGLKK